LLVFGVLAACTLGGSPSDDDDDDDGGSAGFGSGSGSGSGSGGSDASGPCGDYAPFDEVGLTLTYRFTDDYEEETGVSGEWTVSYEGPDGDGGTYSSLTTFAFELSGIDDYWSETRTTVSCDADGVHDLGWSNETAYVAGGALYETWGVGEYREPLPLQMPATLAVGDTWTSEGSYEYEDSNGTSMTESFSSDFEVVESGSVTVPAGTFSAMRVVNDVDGASTWYAEGVGMIEGTGYTELVSVD